MDSNLNISHKPSKICSFHSQSVSKKGNLITASCFLFRIVNKGFKYLGVVITPTFSSLFTKNFIMNFPLSIARHIYLVKMTVLPKFLFLFQNFPVFIKKKKKKHSKASLLDFSSFIVSILQTAVSVTRLHSIGLSSNQCSTSMSIFGLV